MECKPAANKSAHRAVNPRSQHKVIVIWHQLIAKKLRLMELKSCVQNSLEGVEIGVFVTLLFLPREASRFFNIPRDTRSPNKHNR